MKQCSECDGEGVLIQMIRMGPMIQQTLSACGNCEQAEELFDQQSALLASPNENASPIQSVE